MYIDCKPVFQMLVSDLQYIGLHNQDACMFQSLLLKVGDHFMHQRSLLLPVSAPLFCVINLWHRLSNFASVSRFLLPSTLLSSLSMHMAKMQLASLYPNVTTSSTDITV